MKYKTGDGTDIYDYSKSVIENIKEGNGIPKEIIIQTGQTYGKSANYVKDIVEQVKWERDWCDGCKYRHLMGGQEPCKSCRCNYTSKFEPKTEEIHVGDEVVHDGDNTKAVAYQVTDNAVYVLQRNNSVVWSNLLRCEWNPKHCHRTGKTYPELIKALESLPRE